MSDRWNPNAPEILGLEWWPTVGAERPVNAGRAPFQRLRSSAAESISTITTEGIGNRSRTDPLHMFLEVIEQGNEFPGPENRLDVVELAPNAHGSSIGQWTTHTGSIFNLHNAINEPVRYPPVTSTWIRTRSALNAAHFHVGASVFDSGGSLETARICRVSIVAVLAVDPNPDIGRRPVQFELRHVPSGRVHSPPGNSFWGHFYGQLEVVDCGEVNPETGLPWLPSDIAEFDGGDWEVRVLGQGATRMGVRVHSLALRVQFLPTENRVAVGSMSRNDFQIGSNGFLFDGAAARDIISLPSGDARWAKPDSGDFLFAWRRAHDVLVNRSQPRATDIHHMWAYQDLGPKGEPPGVTPPIDEGVRLRTITLDEFGVATSAWSPGPRQAAAPMVLKAEGSNVGDHNVGFTSGGDHVAPSLPATAAGLLVCHWAMPTGLASYTVPGSMTPGTELSPGTTTTTQHATEVLAAGGATGTRTATASGGSDAFAATSVALTGSISIEEVLEDTHDNEVVFNTAAGTQAGWHLLAMHTVAEDPHDDAMGGPSGGGWSLLADTMFNEWAFPHTRVWIKEVESSGAQQVTFTYNRGYGETHARLLVLSGVAGSFAVTSPDSQPYRFNIRDLAHSDAVLTQSGGARSQLVTAPATESYLGVKFPVIPPPIFAAAFGSITASVVRDSDEQQMGGTFTIGGADVRRLPAAGGGTRYIEGLLSAPAELVADEAYHLRLEVSGPGEWLLHTPVARFDGTSKFGHGAGDSLVRGSGGSKTPVPAKDLCVALVAQPDPPDDFAAAVVDVSGTFADLPGGIHAPDVDTIQAIQASWTPTAHGSEFDHYELERQEGDEDADWHLVARIFDESVDSHTDLITPRGTPARYRLRVMLTDHAFSAWTTSEFQTAEATKTEILFVSDHQPELSVAYMPGESERHAFPAGAENEFRRIEGAPYVVHFKVPREADRGRTTHLRIFTTFGAHPAAGGGRQAFDALYELAQSDDIPYVVVLDHLGNRWFGALVLEGADVVYESREYAVDVSIIPTQGEPTPVVIEAS